MRPRRGVGARRNPLPCHPPRAGDGAGLMAAGCCRCEVLVGGWGSLEPPSPASGGRGWTVVAQGVPGRWVRRRAGVPLGSMVVPERVGGGSSEPPPPPSPRTALPRSLRLPRRSRHGIESRRTFVGERTLVPQCKLGITGQLSSRQMCWDLLLCRGRINAVNRQGGPA